MIAYNSLVIAFLLISGLLALLPDPVRAGWSAEQDIPQVSDTGQSIDLSPGISCVSWGADRLDCFVPGDRDGQLYQIWFDGSQRGGWTSLGGPFFALGRYRSSGPSCTSWAKNRIDCFTLGSDGALLQLTWDGGWRRVQDLGGQMVNRPICKSWGINRIDCFSLGAPHQIGFSTLWHRYWDGNSWGLYESLGGLANNGSHDPDCLSWGPNRLDCFVVGTDGAIWHRWWDETGWRGWESLQGAIHAIGGGPSCTSWGVGRIDCFVMGTDKSLWHNWFADGLGWAGWHNRNVNLVFPPKCMSVAIGEIHCLAVGTTGFSDTSWKNGVRSGPTRTRAGQMDIPVAPECIAWTKDKMPRIDCFYLRYGTSGGMKHIWWTP